MEPPSTGHDPAFRQDWHWSNHSSRYHEVFLDPFRPGVENPLMAALEAVEAPASKVVADLGCGTGPLLPTLAGRFGSVIALDFAPGMIEQARARMDGVGGDRIAYLNRPMHDLDEFEGRLDVAVAVNSLVMPDVRQIERTLRAIRKALRPGGLFLGVLPAIDAIHYHTMLLLDRALDRGHSMEEAERLASYHAEHQEYDFAFGRFAYQGLRQKFWQGFEVPYRLKRAGFGSIEVGQVLYPWDDSLPEGPSFSDQPRSWDWFFAARPSGDEDEGGGETGARPRPRKRRAGPGA
ncbi:MAG: class I SAM-dependent methyltransferase [Isosphaeraceae bacterium]